MATRLYFVANSTPPVTPDIDAWSSTTGSVQRMLSTTKDAATEQLTVNIPATGGQSGLVIQAVSPPLAAQTISGTVSVEFRARENNTQANVNKRWRSVRVINSAGVTVATLDSLVATTSTTELSGTTIQGQTHANGSGFTSYNCADGDRLLVAVGYGTSAGGTSPQAICEWGGSGTDHALANSDTTGTVPWVEFSGTLVWQATGPSSVSLAPATLSLTAPATTPTPQPVTVTLTPATMALTAPAVAPTPQPGSVALTAAGITMAATPVSPVPQPVSVSLAPAVMALSARPATPTPQPVVVALAPAGLGLVGVPLTPAPQPVSVALSPAAMTLLAPPVGVAGVGSVALTPATFSLTARPVTGVPGPVTVQLTAAALALAGRAVTPQPVAVRVNLVAAGLTLAAPAVVPGPRAVTVLLAPAGLSLLAVPVTPLLIPRAVINLVPARLTLSVGRIWSQPTTGHREAELDLQRRQTDAFIRANPVTLVLTPRQLQKTGTGITYVDQTPRPAQEFRLIDQSSPSGNQPTSTSIDGKQRKVVYQLLGRWDAEIGLWDYWVDGQGFRCEVAELLPDNGYEQRAQVVRYGQA